MNIFYLDKKPEKCAKYHCNKHVVKMILEYTQILSSVKYRYGEKGPLKLTHKNHPCVLWAGDAHNNFMFLKELVKNLLKEYTYRFTKHHKYENFYFDKEFVLEKRFLVEEFSPPPKCMPEKYKQKDTVTSYRNYYLGEKSRFAKWTKRKIPKWYMDGVPE